MFDAHTRKARPESAYVHRWIDGSPMEMPLGKCVCAGRNYAEHARELFGAEFVDGFLASKRMELQSFMDEITPWERRFLGSQV